MDQAPALHEWPWLKTSSRYSSSDASCHFYLYTTIRATLHQRHVYEGQYPSLKRRGLYLRSTATRHTGEGVPLSLHRATHPGHQVTLGQSTSAPSWSSLAGPGAFAS